MNTITTKFSELPLIEPIQRALKDKGYEVPTPIQFQAIPPLLEGRDLIGCAQTGTGKTAAFTLPILQMLDAATHNGKAQGTKGPRALIVAPTRELAVQIDDSLRNYSKHMTLKHLVVFGGVSQYHQVKALREGIDILVATPGRLLDLKNQGFVRLDKVEILVLDEADRMLDMGFIPDVRRIAAAVPADRQTLLFSATMPDTIRHLAEELLTKPVRISITPTATTPEKIHQEVYFVSKENKRQLMLDIIKARPKQEISLVFSRTKHGADKLAKALSLAGIPSDALHGNKSQASRQRALDMFRKGKIQVLVATDIASRGIDVPGVALIMNYDLPEEAETYVHRIGRTARAGESGQSITLCSPDEISQLRQIERTTGRKLNIVTAHNFHNESAASAVDTGATFDRAGRTNRRPSQNRNARPQRSQGDRSSNDLSQDKGMRSNRTRSSAPAGAKLRQDGEGFFRRGLTRFTNRFAAKP